MTIEFGQNFAPTWAGKPPGISPEDLDIWKRWRPREFKRYERFNFNVRLMRPIQLDPDVEDNIRRMAEFNAAKRIDVLGWGKASIDILELRNNAGLSAIGQVLGYRKLLQRDLADPRPIKMIIITNRDDPDVVETAEATGITLEVV
jgi:hypothetical protein